MQQMIAMDDAAADWYSYHFHDTLFLNDWFWALWREKLQKTLNEDQLSGKICSFCGRDYDPETSEIEFIGGYKVAYCKEPCHIKIDEEIDPDKN